MSLVDILAMQFVWLTASLRHSVQISVGLWVNQTVPLIEHSWVLEPLQDEPAGDRILRWHFMKMRDEQVREVDAAFKKLARRVSVYVRSSNARISSCHVGTRPVSRDMFRGMKVDFVNQWMSVFETIK